MVFADKTELFSFSSSVSVKGFVSASICFSVSSASFVSSFSVSSSKFSLCLVSSAFSPYLLSADFIVSSGSSGSYSSSKIIPG